MHVDQGLVSSRKPDDLKAYCAKIVEELSYAAFGEGASVSPPDGPDAEDDTTR